jgi:histidinol dehydrogenase
MQKLNIYNNPPQEELIRLLERPKGGSLPDVSLVFNEISKSGDAALRDFTLQWDNVALDNLWVSEKELAEATVPTELEKAIKLAKENVEKFHLACTEKNVKTATMDGVVCERLSVGIQNVGLYIPGGSAPLFSTALMLGIPAKIAGCKEIIIASPPNKAGEINSAILYTANLLGIKKVLKSGGAQAIAAMALGTESVPKVDKLFGPGNSFVMAAKQRAFQEGVAIDMPAGPSEVMVIADDKAEHGPDSQVILVTTSQKMAEMVVSVLPKLMENLPRKEIIEEALKSARIIVVSKINEAVDISNIYAPEHLILAIENPRSLLANLTTAGSVFLGNYSAESLGDYASGPNHTLPTNGAARAWSGLSVKDFSRTFTVQEVSEVGIKNLGATVEIMANAEGLHAHALSVTKRLEMINAQKS